ncbi:hypothetical protein B0H16DRAFT_1455730 [Mycena metata]|uniref:Uncharacterized protein n=1 Tax=Mycena metata TaxID=1033252 RepID=A0AAD7JD51_9AGAR|nr:hypothetical protein B0H16DRAFT_1455730 [Mycena metata]
MPLATVIQSRRRNNVIHYQATHTTKKLTVNILLPLACSWEHRNYSAVVTDAAGIYKRPPVLVSFSEEFDEYNQPLLAAEIWVDDRDEVVYVEMNRCTGGFTLRAPMATGDRTVEISPESMLRRLEVRHAPAPVGDGAVPGQATRNLVKKKVVDEVRARRKSESISVRSSDLVLPRPNGPPSEVLLRMTKIYEEGYTFKQNPIRLEKYLRNKELLSARTGISLNLIQPYTVAITEFILGIDNNPFAVFKYSLQFWKPPAPPMKFSWPADAQSELCPPCVAFGKKHYREGIERLWKELPSFLRSY